MSSTDAISLRSFHESNNATPVLSSRGKSRRSSGLLSSQKEVSEEVEIEIQDLHDSVPQVAQFFDVLNKIGSGTFSSVYVARIKNQPDVKDLFALKHIIPTSHPSRIENELRCLQEIGGEDSVMGVKACFRHRDHVVIVMPYFSHDRFQDYVGQLSLAEARDYMRNLLVALRRVHRTDIIHRDVKPSNFLYNRKTKQYALVDFGLAQKAPVALQQQTPDDKSRKSGGGHHSAGKETSRKRQHPSDDAENTRPGSPCKKRVLSPSNGGDEKPRLAEIDTNVLPMLHGNCRNKTPDAAGLIACDKLNQESLEKSNVNRTPNVTLNSRHRKAVKSPRRIVLTRALNKAGEEERREGPPPAKTVVVEQGGRSVFKSVAPKSCDCYGKPVICTACMARSGQHAPRAGTPGFRAPEVLMKCPDQTTAVDIWSAGVIFLSILSGRYPFFKAPDDMTALAQIISVAGVEVVQDAAKAIGKHLICNPKCPAMDLRVMCQRLRSASCQTKKGPKQGKDAVSDWSQAPQAAYDLLSQLLDINPHTRITADEALRHPFFSHVAMKSQS